MKNLLVLFVVIFGFTLTSCNKEEFQTTQDVVEDAGAIDETISVFGDWLLVDGKMYIENLETGEKTVYDHFDSNKDESSLRYDGWLFEFEKITRNGTMWTFKEPNSIPGTGEFWLNNDSINPYGFFLTNSNMTIVENSTGTSQLGGSSRPLTAYLDDYNTNQVNFYVQETYAPIDGVNYKYFSELTFEKQL